MSYLRLIQDKIQDLAEDINSATKVDVTVVDENLIRIGGTGDYYSMIDECTANNSLFAKILKSGREQLNISTLASGTIPAPILAALTVPLSPEDM